MASNLSISITQNSQNVANNTSNVTVKVSIYSEASWNSDASSTSGSYCTINGTKRSFTHTFTKGTTQIYSWTGDIAHNADGSKTLSVYASFNTVVSLGTLTKSASKTLTAIPRASTPTLSALSFNAGSALTITTNRASSSFTHTLTYSLNGSTGTIASGVGASYTWTAANTKELARLIPNKTSDTVTVTCKTYNGSTLIGTKTVTATIKIPEATDFMPSISSITVEDAKGYVAKYGAYIQGKSVPKITINAAPAYSTLKSYKFIQQGKSIITTYNNLTVTTLSATGTLNIECAVTDGRGRTASKTVSINVLKYAAPTLSLKVVRCNADLTENDSGAYAKLTSAVSIAPLNDKNANSVVLQYKRKNATDWTEIKSWTAYTVNEDVLIEAPTDASYDVRLVAADDFTGDTKATSSTSLSTVEVIMDFNTNGKGLAIGKISEDSNFEVDWNAVFNKPVTLEDNLTGKHLAGTWLRATAITDLGKAAAKVAVLDASGWIYYRTLAELLGDVGIIPVENGGTGQANAYTSFTCGRLNSSYNTITSQDCRYYPYLGLCTAHIRITVGGYNLAADTSFGLVQIPSAYAPSNMYGCTIYTSARNCKGYVLSKSNETQPRHIRVMVDTALNADYDYNFDVTAWWYL